MKGLVCIECSLPAKWKLELPDGGVVYTCELHRTPIRDQLQALFNGEDNPQFMLDLLLKSIQSQNVAHNRDEPALPSEPPPAGL